jgi:hypothetical protein
MHHEQRSKSEENTSKLPSPHKKNAAKKGGKISIKSKNIRDDPMKIEDLNPDEVSDSESIIDANGMLCSSGIRKGRRSHH